MERVVNISKTFADADAWDIRQHRSMSPQERMLAARALKDKLYGKDAKDVRECHRTSK